MKKFIILLVMLIMAFSFQLIVIAEEKMDFAENEEYDALNIDDTIKRSLQIKSDDTIIRVLNTPIVFAFNEYSDIDALLTGDYIDQVLYAIVNDKSIEAIYLVDNLGESTTVENSLLSRDYKTVSVLLQNDVIDSLPEGAEITNIFYFWGQSNHQGSALYYRTNKGGFVYYRSYLNNDTQYLFPEQDFFNYMKALYSTLGPDNPPGSIEMESSIDISKYEISLESLGSNKSATVKKTSSFIFVIIVFASILLLSIFIIGFIFIIKRPKYNK